MAKPALKPPLLSDPALRRLALATLTLACAAPVITRLSRMEGLSLENYPIFERLFTLNDHVQSLAMLA
ncbi:hypothetical protein NL393_35290, partial [Klebsiella pneumoniae]|nr:hypothetical protein [Klebsiella pneumoniae]